MNFMAKAVLVSLAILGSIVFINKTYAQETRVCNKAEVVEDILNKNPGAFIYHDFTQFEVDAFNNRPPQTFYDDVIVFTKADRYVAVYFGDNNCPVRAVAVTKKQIDDFLTKVNRDA